MSRLLNDIDQFINMAKKSLESDPRSSKSALSSQLSKLKESKEELEQFRRLTEEERNAKQAILLRRGESNDTDVEDSPAARGRTRNSGNPTPAQRRYAYRKTASVGDPGDGGIWRSLDSTNGGSTNSLASNSSIPLPIPVRTRGSESGYSSDTFNTLNIRRLERDTSLDRMSTGSRESGRSTQSELVRGERKKRKAGLIGKLKKLTRGLSAERDFGSGSDISSTSVASSAASKARPKSIVKDAKETSSRSSTLSRVQRSTIEESNPNKAYDQYFERRSRR